MENNSIFKKISLDIAHLPTIMLVIGYPAYWIELYFLNSHRGTTTPLAFLIFSVFSILICFNHARVARVFLNDFLAFLRRLDFVTRFFLASGGFLILCILGCAFYASLLPPHLTQEFDVLNYHLTIPRQHLILNTFKHIPWSTADLYFLPIDFALSPFWFVTQLPNKFPQFLFLLGLVGVSVNVVKKISNKNLMSICLIVLAIFGSHHLGIQMGTAMLDIVNCYLFIAALDSLLSGWFLLGMIEFTFFFWAKSFIPIQTAVMVILVLGCIILLRFLGWKKMALGFEGQQVFKKMWSPFPKLLAGFLLLSLVIGGPFVVKSLYYAGTPLFPFAPGLIPFNKNIDHSSAGWQALIEKAKLSRNTRDQYGSGRSFKDFIIHWWLIAVPEKGVNNRYDYPAGLMYLLFLGLFLYFSWRALRQGKIPLLTLIVMSWWATWWLGSQQTRFLLVPMVLMLVLGSAYISNPSRILQAVILFALGLVALSVYGAHHRDWRKSVYEVLREKDKELLMINQISKGEKVTLNFPDAAFAAFPVDVRNNHSVFVINPSTTLPGPRLSPRSGGAGKVDTEHSRSINYQSEGVQ